MWHFIIALDAEALPLQLDNSCLVLVAVAVVGSTENSNDCGQCLRFLPVVHFVPLDLHLVSSDHHCKVIVLQYLFDRLESILVRASSLLVVSELVLVCLRVIQGVRPKQIAYHTF